MSASSIKPLTASSPFPAGRQPRLSHPTSGRHWPWKVFVSWEADEAESLPRWMILDLKTWAHAPEGLLDPQLGHRSRRPPGGGNLEAPRHGYDHFILLPSDASHPRRRCSWRRHLLGRILQEENGRGTNNGTDKPVIRQNDALLIIVFIVIFFLRVRGGRGLLKSSTSSFYWR